jgi:hypothetical protein
MTRHFEHWHNLTLHQNRVNLGQLRVNLNENLDKVVENKCLMGEKNKIMTTETMTKNGKYSSD